MVNDGVAGPVQGTNKGLVPLEHVLKNQDFVFLEISFYIFMKAKEHACLGRTNWNIPTIRLTANLNEFSVLLVDPKHALDKLVVHGLSLNVGYSLHACLLDMPLNFFQKNLIKTIFRGFSARTSKESKSLHYRNK